MPRPDETPVPAYERGSELPYGEATAANTAPSTFADTVAELNAGTPAPEPFTPSNPEESYLFSPTERPNEPITAGAPFGSGPNLLAPTPPDPTAFVRDVAAALEPEAARDPVVRRFLADALAGR